VKDAQAQCVYDGFMGEIQLAESSQRTRVQVHKHSLHACLQLCLHVLHVSLTASTLQPVQILEGAALEVGAILSPHLPNN